MLGRILPGACEERCVNCSPFHKRVGIGEARGSHESAVAVRSAGDPRMLRLHTHHGVFDVQGEGFEQDTAHSQDPVESDMSVAFLDSCTYIYIGDGFSRLISYAYAC